MRYTNDDLEAAAEYICVQLHPEEIRADYVRNIRVHYRAEEIVYVLQALSSGMTGLFIGLFTNYLYDKVKKPDSSSTELKKLLEEQNGRLGKLEKLLAKECDLEFADIARKHRDLHQKIVCQIQDSNPEIERIVEDVLEQLRRRGRNALTDDVDSHDF